MKDVLHRCNTSGMTQPKAPPLSIRLPPDLAAEVQKHADQQELTRHAAIIALLRQALAGHSPTKQMLQELQTAQMQTAAKPALKPKAKAEALPQPKVSVSIPLKTNDRASFDRLQKKGKK